MSWEDLVSRVLPTKSSIIQSDEIISAKNQSGLIIGPNTETRMRYFCVPFGSLLRQVVTLVSWRGLTPVYLKEWNLEKLIPLNAPEGYSIFQSQPLQSDLAHSSRSICDCIRIDSVRWSWQQIDRYEGSGPISMWNGCSSHLVNDGYAIWLISLQWSYCSRKGIVYALDQGSKTLHTYEKLFSLGFINSLREVNSKCLAKQSFGLSWNYVASSSFWTGRWNKLPFWRLFSQ